MILPSKHLPPHRALLGVGASLLPRLTEPKTVSRLWNEAVAESDRPIRYDWFVLALDLLYAMGAVDLEGGRIRRTDK